MGRVLVYIDDDAFLTQAVGLALKVRGVDVHTACNAVDGRRLVSEVDPDLIIVDVIMPGEDGIEATRALRAAGVTVPIIVFTGLEGDGTEAAAMEAGATAVLTKPFQIQGFHDLIDSLLTPPD